MTQPGRSTKTTMGWISPYEGAAERTDAVSRSYGLRLRRELSKPSMLAMMSASVIVGEVAIMFV